MTMFSGRQTGTSLPDGVTVATYRSYETAQKAMNSLAEADIDVAGMALVGGDVKVVERVVGKLTWRKVALAGAMRGLTFGLILGIIFWLLVGNDIGIAILAIPVLGVGFGMLLSIVTHTFTRRNRQYQSVQQLIPATFDLVAPREVAAAVMHKLGPQGRRPAEGAGSPSPERGALPDGETSPETSPSVDESSSPTGSAQPPESSSGEPVPAPESSSGSAAPSAPGDVASAPESSSGQQRERVPNPLAGSRREGE